MKETVKKETKEHFGMRMKASVKRELETVAEQITQKKRLVVTSSALAGLLIEDGLKRIQDGLLQL
ncbi:MAG: hypothetical protein WBV94_04425 [Blastocatellia bacterium]